METQERLLIREDADRVAEVRNEATWNVQRLNDAYHYAPFTSREELRQLIAELPAYRKLEMNKDKGLREALRIGLNPPVPAEIIRREDALKAAVDSFQYARFNGTTWVIDTEAVEDAADRFRKYITEGWQFDLYHKQQKVARAMNEIPMGPNTILRNWHDNEVVRYNSRTKQFEPNTATLFASENIFKS